jgi:oligosaccharide repeat unit polymerase
MFSFLYPFLTFLQPGMLWPDLVDLRPAIVAAVVSLVFGLSMKSSYARGQAFKSKPFVYLSLFLLAQALSLYSSGVSSIIDEFAFWFPFWMFVVVSIVLMPNAQSLRRYVWGMIVGAMVVVIYGIYAVPAWGGYEGTGRAGAYGMYDNHNDYSFIIIQIVPFIYMFWRIEVGRIRRWLLLFSLLACSLGIAMSMSRGGMITLVVQGALIVIMGMEGRRRLWLLPALALVGSAAIAFQYAQRAENQGDRYTAEDAESSRYELWKAGGNMVLAKPVLGVGSRRFYEHSMNYYDLADSQKGKNSHNTFIEILAGSGLVGFLTFVLSGRNLTRELRRRPTVKLSPFIDATRKATVIAMYSIVLRALLDAKIYDWCFYTMGAIGIACFMIMRAEEAAAEKAAVPSEEPTAPPQGVPDTLRYHPR